MKRQLWIVGLVGVAAIAGFLVWSVSRPNYREIRTTDGTIVLGSNKGVWWMPRQFWSVRIEEVPAGSAIRSAVRLHFRGRARELRNVSPSDLAGMSIQVDRRDNASPDDRHAFLGFGDQNRDGALEFEFAAGRLRAFYARCHVPAGCGFELSWPDRPRFQLPLTEERVPVVLGQGISVRDYRGH